MNNIYENLAIILENCNFYYEKAFAYNVPDFKTSAFLQAAKVEAYTEILEEIDPVGFEKFYQANEQLFDIAAQCVYDSLKE